MGYILYRITAQPAGTQRWRVLAFYLFAANAPDLDFIPGLLIGDPNRYHHGISHSLGFAVLFALACSLAWDIRTYEPIWRKFAIFCSLYSSHLGLDFLSIDTRAPYGEPLFWPLTDAYYIASFAFLPDIKRAPSSLEFFPSLLSLHNLFALGVELVLVFPLLMLLRRLRQPDVQAILKRTGYPKA
jgi:inner membrane protein